MQDSSIHPATETRPAEDNEVLIRAAFAYFRAYRWRIAVFTLACILIAGIASYVVPKQYEAVLVVSPVSSSGSSGLGAVSSAMSSLGGIASLAGLALPSNGGAKAESLATLESEALTRRFISENNLLPVLYANKWNEKEQKWKPMSDSRKPTLWKANQYFKDKIRTTKENARTGMVTMTITWSDPRQAADWANGLIKMTNDYLRDKAIRESERNITYLNEQLAKTPVIELRVSIYGLMESEIKKQMLARGNEDYALKIIDAATVPEKPSSPQPLLWMLAALCIGLLLSTAIIFFKLITPRSEKG